MQEEERIFSKIKSEESLSFIESFLRDNKAATAYLVGGAVRDALLGRKVKDFDFVIGRMEPKKIEQWFGSRGELNLVGEHFGVYKFMPSGFSRHDIEFIDIALPRTEAVTSGSLGGYHDFNVQSDPNLPIEDDLKRRDFTINAMAFDLRNRMLIDPFDGQRDLERKLIRAVGTAHERFGEDLTRILRAIRFSAELDFEIEAGTSLAIRELTPRVNLLRERDGKNEFVVPREMVGEELFKSFTANPERTVLLLKVLGTMKELFPHVTQLISNDSKYLNPIGFTKPNESHIAIALLLRGLGEEQIDQAIKFTGLDRLPKNIQLDSKRLAWLSSIQKVPISTDKINSMPASAFENGFMSIHGLARVRCLELIGETSVARAATARRKKIENTWLVDETETIAPLLSGNDIIALGIQPGPEVRRLLNLLRDEQLDGRLLSREAALKWVRNQKPRKPL